MRIKAENIQFVSNYLDPKRRILKGLRSEQFQQQDYKAINAYIRRRGSIALNSDEEFQSQQRQSKGSNGEVDEHELIRRDIAYFIRNLQSKKHLQNDFVIEGGLDEVPYPD